MTYTLYHGDCLEVLPTLDDRSVDAIVTDPPYQSKYNALWRPFAAQAARVLRDGGELITLFGHYQLPIVMEAFAATSLRYWWICGMRQHARRRMLGKNVNIYFKPALWFVKGKKRTLRDMPSDLVAGSKPLKQQHVWEQGTAWFMHWCDRICDPGETILDPFMGVGTTGEACVATGRNFVGIELLQEYYTIAEQRLASAAARSHQLDLQI